MSTFEPKTLRTLAGALLLSLGLATAAAERWIEGEHFQSIPVPVATGSDEVVVTEFFSYGCVHCFSFDPYIEAWVEELPEGVKFERVPAVFSRSWVLLAEAYYVAEVCETLPVTHQPFFEALHVKRIPMRSQEAVAEFYADLVADAGVETSCSTKDEFMAAFKSFGVSAAVQQSMGKGRAFQANGVPAMIIDGRYRTDGNMAGSNEGMLEVVDQLVARQQAGGEATASAN